MELGTHFDHSVAEVTVVYLSRIRKRAPGEEQRKRDSAASLE